MKFINRIFEDRIDGLEQLSPGERTQVEQDPRLTSAMAENRALRSLSTDPGPAPDRGRLLELVYHEAESMEEPPMSLLNRLFTGKRWYAQAGLALGVLLIIGALAVFLPTDSTMRPPPAWGQTNGYRLNYNLGRVTPQLVSASLGLPASLLDGQAYTATSSKVNVITSQDLTDEQLAKLKEALGLIVDGEIQVLAADSLDPNSGDFPAGITIVLSDTDKAEIERIISSFGEPGEVVALEGLKIYAAGGGTADEVEMLVRSHPDGAVCFGDNVDAGELKVLFGDSGAGEELAAALAAAGEGLKQIQLDSLTLNGTAIDAEALSGIKAAQDGLAQVDLQQLQIALGDEQYAQALQALEDARSELAAIDVESLVIELQGLDSAEIEANLATATAQLKAVQTELSGLDLAALQADLAEAQRAVAGEELQRALVVLNSADLDDVVMKMGEINTIDLSELENAVKDFQYLRVGEGEAPVNVETQVVDGELYATIDYGAEDAAGLEDLKISLSQWFEGLPDPEVSTGTWFYDPDAEGFTSVDGTGVNVLGHYFQFPADADAGEIQDKLGQWFEVQQPDGATAPVIKVIRDANGKELKVVVLSGWSEADDLDIEALLGDYQVRSTTESAAAATVVIDGDDETGEPVIYIDGQKVEPDDEDDGTVTGEENEAGDV